MTDAEMLDAQGELGSRMAPFIEQVLLAKHSRGQPEVAARLGSTHPARGKWQVYPFGYLSR
jgi:hypothetical protein